MNNILNRFRKLSPYAVSLVLFAALSFMMLWSVSESRASGDIIVNSPTDAKQNDGQCTLREAIIAANTDKRSGGKPGECPAGNGADTIILAADTYSLTRSDSGKEDASQTGDLDITDDLTIVGGPGVTIEADGINDRILHVVSGNVSISGVTIQGGNVPGDGGGIYNSGILLLEKIALTGNMATGKAGGIYNAASGTLVVTNSTISGNSAPDDAGGIFNAGTLTLNSVTLSHIQTVYIYNLTRAYLILLATSINNSVNL